MSHKDDYGTYISRRQLRLSGIAAEQATHSSHYQALWKTPYLMVNSTYPWINYRAGLQHQRSHIYTPCDRSSLLSLAKSSLRDVGWNWTMMGSVV